jgi:plastocyanin
VGVSHAAADRPRTNPVWLLVVLVMVGLAFAPGTLTVARGATVVFDNDDTAPHTVTARSGGVDSGVLDPGRQFSLTVTDGFDYVCSIHPGMTAKIAVTG